MRERDRAEIQQMIETGEIDVTPGKFSAVPRPF